MSYNNFDMEVCKKLAGVSAASYLSSKAYVHRLRKIGLKDHNYKLFKNKNAECYVTWDDNEVIVSWRGTQPTQINDILDDLKITKQVTKYGKIHSGFKGYVDKVYKLVFEQVNRLMQNSNRKLYVTGHSLGAAAAIICTNRFEDKFDVEACYTYGSPRPGGIKYSVSVKTPVYRVRNNNDIVTKVPLKVLGYKHIGQLCYIDRKGVLRTGNVAWYVLLKNWFFGQFERFGDGLQDHSIGEYYTKLLKATRIHKK